MMAKYKIGVMGSAWGKQSDEVVKKAHAIGKMIAENNCILVTGACPGVPYEASLSAKQHGGFTVGFSPACNMKEHASQYKYPDDFDFLVFTGFGKKGRNVVSIRTCDAVIFISGGSGSLNEFTIAYDEEKLCGVLTQTGGITEMIKDMEEKCLSGRKACGKVIYDENPERLVERIMEELKK